MAGTHRLCESILPIEVAAKNVKKSAMLDDTAKEISSIIKSLESLDIQQAVNEKNLEEESYDIVKQISTVKASMLKRVNDMEKNTLTQLETLKKKHLKAIESNRNEIKSLKACGSKCLEEMGFTVKNGSHKQLFLLLLSLKHQIHEHGERLENMTSTFKTTNLKFNVRDNVLPNVGDFGEIVVNTVHSDVVYNPCKHRQAQVLPTTKKSLLQFKYEREIKTVTSVLRSIVLTDDNRLIICSGQSLFTCDENGKNEKMVALQGCPYRLALIPGRDMVVVVISSPPCKLQFIDVKSLKSVKIVCLECEMFGIAATKSNIFLGGTGCIHVHDANAKYLRRINLSESVQVEYLHIDQNERLYISISNLRTLLCLEQDSTEVFRYHPNDEPFWPNDITTDQNGCVYVVNNSNHNVHRLSPEGKFIDVIAGRDDNVIFPWTCCFNKTYTKLFLPTNNRVTHGTLVFSCK